MFAWHGGQQPNWFFTNGFTYNAANPDWASPATMLKRLDNYIHAMTDKYAKYSDIIVSWDVVNEAIDDYSGQIRNDKDPQVSQWGRIFRRPDLDATPDARLTAESAWVRQAFESARKWANADGVHWKLYYNDYQDSDKLYEPKLSQTIKMLKPIHDAGNIDGYGMQGRLAWAYPTIAMLKAQIEAGLTVADEISITESDIRSDFEPNPDYDPSQPTRPVTAADADDPAHQWPTYGSCSWTNRAAANGNTFDVCNSPVRRIPAWGTGANNTLANSPDIMKKQADFVADWMDLLIVLQEQGQVLRLRRHVGLVHVQQHRRRPPVVGPRGQPGEVLLLRRARRPGARGDAQRDRARRHARPGHVRVRRLAEGDSPRATPPRRSSTCGSTRSPTSTTSRTRPPRSRARSATTRR